MDLDMTENVLERLNFTRLSKPALIGIAAILVMVAVAAGRLLIGTATANDFEVAKASSPAQSQETEASAQEPSTVFVHVSGAVEKPGLVELAPGARVADAVQAAGGFASGAETGSVNLARVLTDGEQVVISEHVEQAVASDGSATSASSGNTAGTATIAGSLVNINTASASELVSLPGIGEATAAKIVSDRQANGSFKTVDDLKRVSGIGDKKFEALSGLICV